MHPAPHSPHLAPRLAQAITAGKIAAERLTPAGLAPAKTAAHDAAQTAPQLEFPDTRVELHLDKDSGLVVGRVIDRRTNEEVRQIPAETMVRLAAALKRELGPVVNIKA